MANVCTVNSDRDNPVIEAAVPSETCLLTVWQEQLLTDEDLSLPPASSQEQHLLTVGQLLFSVELPLWLKQDLLSTVLRLAAGSQPKCDVLLKMEDVIARMQDEKNGIPIRTVKSFLSKIPSVFSALKIFLTALFFIEFILPDIFPSRVIEFLHEALSTRRARIFSQCASPVVASAGHTGDNPANVNEGED
ncbi:Regulator of G-protein signaling 7 [Fukomys damarensis]|uniref:Regulator of G-protein signaling 7 n=1 Tax=Fukomys damarensis TaxID=885580 RepID=A0A091DRP5_FUKDA|nr:Regulator of G-protein signaling 7 [Fukomys damarensis]